MPAPAFRSVTETTIGDATSITGSEPAGVAGNDALIAVLIGLSDANSGFGAVTPPSGWTNEVNTGPDDADAIEQRMYSIRRGASAPSFAWSWVVPSDAQLVITAYSGADPNTLTEVPAGQINASSTSVTAPSITTTVADTRLHFAGSIENSSTFTPPSGMIERADFLGVADINPTALEVADVAQASVGASGTKVATATVAGRNIGQLIAIRPTPPAFISDFRFRQRFLG